MMMILRLLWFWIYFPVVTLLAFFCVWLGQWVFGADYQNYVHRLAILWGKFTIGLMPGWSCEVLGRERLPPPGKAMVIVANHESLTDIWVLFFLNVQFRWLSKIEVFKFPVIGPSMRLAGYIAIDRGNKESHKLAMDQSAQLIRRGTSMLFFPEGTRSETGELRNFKIGAFKLAYDEKVAVLPVAIKGTRNLVPKGSIFPGKAAVTLSILEATTKREDETLEAFAARVRAAIIAETQKL